VERIKIRVQKRVSIEENEALRAEKYENVLG
jgi:hypothetical protein